MNNRLPTLRRRRKTDTFLIMIWFITGSILSVMIQSPLGYLVALLIPILVWIERGSHQDLL